MPAPVMLMSHTRKGKSMLDGGRCFSVGRLQHADTSPSAASHLDVAVRLFFPDAEQQTNDVIVVSRRDRRAAVSARASKGGRALPSATLKAGRSVQPVQPCVGFFPVRSEFRDRGRNEEKRAFGCDLNGKVSAFSFVSVVEQRRAWTAAERWRGCGRPPRRPPTP